MTLQSWKLLLIQFDKFLKGWKTFIAFVIVMAGLYLMPEGKAQYIVATAGVFIGSFARLAKKVNVNDL